MRQPRPRNVSPMTFSLTGALDAAPERVFDAWTVETRLAQWMRPHDVNPSAIAVDFTTGGWYRIQLTGRYSAWEIAGKYIEAERPRRLRFSWASPVTHDRPTEVTLVLSPLGEDQARTRFELVHERLPGPTAHARHEELWRDLLGKLGAYLAETRPR